MREKILVVPRLQRRNGGWHMRDDSIHHPTAAMPPDCALGTERHYLGLKFTLRNEWKFFPNMSLFHRVNTTVGEKRPRQVLQATRTLQRLPSWQSYCPARRVWMFYVRRRQR